ncbi:MAG: hypothetical protein Q4E57_07405 [Eubacteriales bacterium]|nr:hypothetical protein [Eubacteriales bacterium]
MKKERKEMEGCDVFYFSVGNEGAGEFGQELEMSLREASGASSEITLGMENASFARALHGSENELTGIARCAEVMIDTARTCSGSRNIDIEITISITGEKIVLSVMDNGSDYGSSLKKNESCPGQRCTGEILWSIADDIKYQNILGMNYTIIEVSA